MQPHSRQEHPHDRASYQPIAAAHDRRSTRKLAPKTQHDYVQRVKDFAAFLGRSPDTAKSEDVRRFRLHLTSSGAGTPKVNATVAALRFFFKVTLDRLNAVDRRAAEVEGTPPRPL